MLRRRAKKIRRLMPTETASVNDNAATAPSASAVRYIVIMATPKPTQSDHRIGHYSGSRRAADAAMQNKNDAGEHDRKHRKVSACGRANMVAQRHHRADQQRHHRGTQHEVVPIGPHAREFHVPQGRRQPQGDGQHDGVEDNRAGQRPMHHAGRPVHRDPHGEGSAKADGQRPLLRQQHVSQREYDVDAVADQAAESALTDEVRAVINRQKDMTGPALIGSVATSPPINGPARSAVIVAANKKAAVTAMRIASVSAK